MRSRLVTTLTLDALDMTLGRRGRARHHPPQRPWRAVHVDHLRQALPGGGLSQAQPPPALAPTRQLDPFTTSSSGLPVDCQDLPIESTRTVCASRMRNPYNDKPRGGALGESTATCCEKRCAADLDQAFCPVSFLAVNRLQRTGYRLVVPLQTTWRRPMATLTIFAADGVDDEARCTIALI